MLLKQIVKDIQLLKNNIQSKLLELLDLGIDLDEVFYEFRDDEELKWEQKGDIDMLKSAICKNLKFRWQVGLTLTERKRNADIQTYNIDFVVEQQKLKDDFREAFKDDKEDHSTEVVRLDREEGQYIDYMDDLKREKERIRKEQIIENLKKEVLKEQMML